MTVYGNIKCRPSVWVADGPVVSLRAHKKYQSAGQQDVSHSKLRGCFPLKIHVTKRHVPWGEWWCRKCCAPTGHQFELYGRGIEKEAQTSLLQLKKFDCKIMIFMLLRMTVMMF